MSALMVQRFEWTGGSEVTVIREAGPALVARFNQLKGFCDSLWSRHGRRLMAAKEISVKKYVVRLSGEERDRLEALIRKGKGPAPRRWRISASMIYRVRKQLVEEGFEAVLSRQQRAMPAVARIFEEAKLIALACSKPPKGRARWTSRLLENKVVELGIVDRARRQHDRADAQKNTLKPHRRQCWVIPAGLPGPRPPRRDAGADPDETGAPGPLRVRAQAKTTKTSIAAIVI
jgi:hypothetical protein